MWSFRAVCLLNEGDKSSHDPVWAGFLHRKWLAKLLLIFPSGSFPELFFKALREVLVEGRGISDGFLWKQGSCNHVADSPESHFSISLSSPPQDAFAFAGRDQTAECQGDLGTTLDEFWPHRRAPRQSGDCCWPFVCSGTHRSRGTCHTGSVGWVLG